MNSMKSEHRVIMGTSQQMPEIHDSTVQLMVTSPPYPMIKMWDKQFCQVDPRIADLWQELEDGCRDETVRQIFDFMHNSLAVVWQEAYRVLVEGGISCINIGDATRTINSKFRLFPNHARIIEQCESIGFTSLPYILWKKPTTKPRYKGKSAFLGSGFLPPNAYITLDCEFILVFRKGKLRKFPQHDRLRYESAFSKKERNVWFSQIWQVKAARQKTTLTERRIAAFPEEIVTRLIRMFSAKGDTVLDPFLGSGTTTKVAIQTERNSIGYEMDKGLLPLIRRKIGFDEVLGSNKYDLQVIER
ncbi:TPA: site-specific DNA-methyltransferase [Candidatus Bathyarchaeota archaeon]|nr:site-specific DNA-methyltransferase [Candidatus Bathyarchaeota archaeon]